MLHQLIRRMVVFDKDGGRHIRTVIPPILSNKGLDPLIAPLIELEVWRDLNQDGRTDVSELFMFGGEQLAA